MTRASDAARDAATERLKDAYVRGELTIDELYGRVSTALVAPTVAGLAGLTSDVPGDTRAFPAVPPAQPVAVHPVRSQRKRVWLAALIIGVLAGATATAVVTNEQNNVPSHCLVMGKTGQFHRVC